MPIGSFGARLEDFPNGIVWAGASVAEGNHLEVLHSTHSHHATRSIIVGPRWQIWASKCISMGPLSTGGSTAASERETEELVDKKSARSSRLRAYFGGSGG